MVREVDRELINKVIKSITDNFMVDEIILFGSYAKGEATEDSDVDIAVISPELDPNSSIFSNVRTVKRKSELLEPYLQLFAFNSKALYNETFVDTGFIQEIKNTGKKIYQKAA